MSAVQQRVAGSAPLLDPDDPALFPKLTNAQVDLLARHGRVRPTAAGDVLFRQGNETYSEREEEKVVVVNMAYLEQHVPLVRGRLKRAGVRLADVLNRTLGQ